MAPVAVDLFCGAGGLSLGLQRGGCRIALAVDSWDIAIETYSRNFEHTAQVRDLAKESGSKLRRLGGFEDVDVVTGGPPCQGFSVQRIGADRDGRNDLVLDFARLVLELKPRLFLMENVPGLLGKRGRAVASRLEETLEDEYEVRHTKVDAADYGVPQVRRRVFYYGWLRDEPEFVFPPPSKAVRRSAWSVIGDLPEPPSDYSPHPDDALHRRMRLSALNLKRLSRIPPGGGMADLPVALRAHCHRDGPDKIGHRAVYGRLAPDEPSATITARFDSFTRGRFAHPFQDRNITLREGARLQTFPDDFAFTGTQEEIAAQIGNAVPPDLATIIGEAISHYFNEQRGAPILREAVVGSVGACKQLLPAH